MPTVIAWKVIHLLFLYDTNMAVPYSYSSISFSVGHVGSTPLYPPVFAQIACLSQDRCC